MRRVSRPYFVYLLLCDDGTFYAGVTTDLHRRLKEHKAKMGGRYTRAHGAKKFVHTERFATRSAASKREAEIKTWRRDKKLGLTGGNNA